MRIACAAAALLVGACSTAEPKPDAAVVPGAVVVDTKLPAWLQAPATVQRDAALEEAAALLCARDTDAVIDDEARHATGLLDGQLTGLLRKAATDVDAQRSLARDAGALLTAKRATHAGVAVGKTATGESCAALVGARRLLVVDGAPPSALPSGGAFDLSVRVPNGATATLYALKPDGFVARWPLADVATSSNSSAAKLTVPSSAGDGRYIAEIVLDRAEGPSDPEVALLWPYVVGAPKDAPFPEVLFPDQGHDDTALTHRAEALVQRLRNEQLIEPFKVSPALVDTAVARAQAVAGRGALGHRLPSSTGSSVDALQDLHARFGDEPRAQFLRLAEVQAQASTLADAWQALLDSPAHRYVLVDTAFTHCGVAVARGTDAAGRATVTMVALLARRAPARDADATRAQILDAANDLRDKRGLTPLTESAHLNRTATRLANAMRDAGKVDEALLGGPIAQVALEADGSLSKVKPLVARTDDPLILLQHGPPALLELDASQAGVGIALSPTDGVFYVVILAGE